jgi:hypothetical protein
MRLRFGVWVLMGADKKLKPQKYFFFDSGDLACTTKQVEEKKQQLERSLGSNKVKK